MRQVDIKDFVNYQITDDGRVWSKFTNKYLSPCTNQGGYKYVVLYNKELQNGKKEIKIARLVAEAFIPNPDNKPCVDHIIPISNGGTDSFENLRWCTYKENNNNPLTVEKYKDRKGEKHPMYGKHHTENSKEKNRQAHIGVIPHYLEKTVYQYTIDGELIASFSSSKEAARNINGSQGNISECCNGKRKTHKGYKWSYKPL